MERITIQSFHLSLGSVHTPLWDFLRGTRSLLPTLQNAADWCGGARGYSRQAKHGSLNKENNYEEFTPMSVQQLSDVGRQDGLLCATTCRPWTGWFWDFPGVDSYMEIMMFGCIWEDIVWCRNSSTSVSGWWRLYCLGSKSRVWWHTFWLVNGTTRFLPQILATKYFLWSAI